MGEPGEGSGGRDQVRPREEMRISGLTRTNIKTWVVVYYSRYLETGYRRKKYLRVGLYVILELFIVPSFLSSPCSPLSPLRQKIIFSQNSRESSSKSLFRVDGRSLDVIPTIPQSQGLPLTRTRTIDFVTWFTVGKIPILTDETCITFTFSSTPVDHSHLCVTICCINRV